jgi:tripartite-type tricarboxylate transporter receptor subunit TctC
VSSVQRSPSVPDIPTTLELDFPIRNTFWIGAFAPAATPRDVVARPHDAITTALADLEVANAIRNLGTEPMPLTPEQFDEFVRREIASNAALVKAAGIPRN